MYQSTDKCTCLCGWDTSDIFVPQVSTVRGVVVGHYCEAPTIPFARQHSAFKGVLQPERMH